MHEYNERRRAATAALALTLAGACSAEPLGSATGVPTGTTATGTMVDGMVVPGGAGTAATSTGTATPGAPTGAAGGGVVVGGAGAGAVVGAGGAAAVTVPAECETNVAPGRAPMRRLTLFEYNNTVREILGDDTNPGNSLPPEVLGNGYGNDADNQPVSSFLVEQYGTIAADIATRMTGAPGQLAALAPCAASVRAETESSCARSFIDAWVPKAYRRPLTAAEGDELQALWQEIRATETFEVSIASVMEAVLQSPDFLYRLEFGEPDAANPALLRPTGHEMATRLSYLFWGTSPDDTLVAAASSGELSTDAGVLSHATRMLDDVEHSRPVIRYFFDHFLPLNTLTDLARDAAQFPTFSSAIGALMREETQTFLEYEIFQGPGTWANALTAPYTFVNETLANYYGMTGVSGDAFVQTPLDTTKRLGLLTQGGIQTGTTISNFTNPVRRGVFLLRNMMCVHLPEPPEEFADSVMPPDPYSGNTGRERYTAHSAQPECAACHAVMDPPGFGLENYDAVGLWRDTENDVMIDASGTLSPAGGAPFSGPIDLVNLIANQQQTYACFAENWLSYAYGRALDKTIQADACADAQAEVAFTQSGYNVKQLLLSLTQTDTFLYLRSQEL